MRIRPEDCDKARTLNDGKIYLEPGDCYVDPECNLNGIQLIGVSKYTTIITSPSGTKHDDRVIQGILDAINTRKYKRGKPKKAVKYSPKNA